MMKMPPFKDWREYTRDAETCTTVISVYDPEDMRHNPWLLFGQLNIREPQGRDHQYNRLCVYLKDTTDFEHDSAYLITIPFIGLRFGALPVRYHIVTLTAWIAPEIGEPQPDFAVPDHNYNPDAYRVPCELERCVKEDPHKISEHYHAPYNKTLHNLVRGRSVEISFGPAAEMKEWVDALLKRAQKTQPQLDESETNPTV